MSQEMWGGQRKGVNTLCIKLTLKAQEVPQPRATRGQQCHIQALRLEAHGTRLQLYTRVMVLLKCCL